MFQEIGMKDMFSKYCTCCEEMRPTRDKYCYACGSHLRDAKVKCYLCGKGAVHIGDKFCRSCGYRFFG